MKHFIYNNRIGDVFTNGPLKIVFHDDVVAVLGHGGGGCSLTSTCWWPTLFLIYPEKRTTLGCCNVSMTDASSDSIMCAVSCRTRFNATSMLLRSVQCNSIQIHYEFNTTPFSSIQFNGIQYYFSTLPTHFLHKLMFSIIRKGDALVASPQKDCEEDSSPCKHFPKNGSDCLQKRTFQKRE